MTDAIAPARRVAFDVLRATARGAHASDALLKRAANLDRRDAGLAEELVFGVLRRQNQLDALIARFGARDLARLDVEVAIALRLGIYQLRHLDRVPPHAAVSESVALVKRASKASAAGLVNAVLRKVTRAPVDFPDRATRLAMPAWLLARWDRHYSPALAEQIAAACLEPPETFIRAPWGLQEADAARAAPTSLPGCYKWLAGDPQGYRIMDAGAQSIVPLLDLQPGQLVLDVCAAPGNKTLQMLEVTSRVVAADRSWRRLQSLRPLAATLVALDATHPLPFRRVFPRILVDAPCSGTGTLRRNPEIKWRLTEADLPRHQQRQVAILRHALAVLEPDGRLVYATCSLEPEENEEVLAQVPEAKLLHVYRRLPGRDEGDGFFAAVITSG